MAAESRAKPLLSESAGGAQVVPRWCEGGATQAVAGPHSLLDLSCIVAVARNRVIGRQGELPWRLKADLQRFRKETLGHHLVMGRKTWESIGRALPGRTSWVLSRSGLRLPPGVHGLGSLADVARLCSGALVGAGQKGKKKVFCIGGAQLYQSVLPHSSELLLTQVEAEVEGDTLFPEIEWNQWTILEKEQLPADAHNDYPTTFLRCQRSFSDD